MVLKKELGFFGGVVVLALAVSLTAFVMDHSDPLILLIRLLALNGYIAIATAAIITPFIKALTRFLRKPFTKVHHYFAAAGLALITLHPVAVVVETMEPALLLPNFASLQLFFIFGGSVALIAIYVAFVAVLLRRRFVTYWRPFHALMYVALFFGVVHANLLGEDLQSLPLRLIYNGLFAATLVGFALKRWQFHQVRVQMQKSAQPKPS